MFGIETGLSYDITLWFNSFGVGVFGYILRLFSIVGNELFYILLIPLIFWNINKSIGKRVVILILLTAYISFLLQNIFLRTGPWDVTVLGKQNIVKRINEGREFGFPSAYIMGVTVLWAYFFTISKKISGKILSVTVIVLAGFSRMVNGVNFIHSVIAAIIIAILILLLFRTFEPRVTTTCNQKYTVLQRVLLICFFTVLAMVILVFFGFIFIEEPIIIVASFFGASLGIVLEKEYLDFNVDGTLVTRIARYLIGMVLISIIFYGVEYLYDLIGMDNNVIQFFKYSILTFIITFVMPKVFVYFNLSKESYSL